MRDGQGWLRERLAAVAAALCVSGSMAADVSFSEDVAPVLRSHCAKCHADGSAKGDFSIDSREAMLAHQGAIVVGDAEGSRLVELVRATNAFDRMPPKGAPLDAEAVAILEQWIDEGAAWDGPLFKASAHAHLAPPRLTALPVRPGLEHPIDRILAEERLAHGATPTPIVDDATFLRRVHLDLVGLLPAPEALDVFCADPAPDKRRRVVGSLLARRHDYAEHWLTFWNDHLRNDYGGTGYIDGGRGQITTWLLTALHDNTPYDVFVAQLVDPVDASAGFARGITWRGEVNASQRPELQYAQNVCQVFLGINMKCASCHDSFIDDWALADAYGVAAIIADDPLELHRCDKPTGTFAQPSFVFDQVGAIDADAPREARLEQFAELMTHPDNGRFSRTIVNRLWARLMGRGLVEPVDDMEDVAWSAALLDHLAAHLRESDYDIQATLELITTSRAYQRRAVAPPVNEAFVFRGPTPQRMTAEQFLDAAWSVSGTGPSKRIAPAFAEVESGTEISVTTVRAAVVHADRLMRALGRPMREQVVTSRPNELTTLQALEFSNGAIAADIVGAGGTNLNARFENPGALVDHVYRVALSRSPRAAERALALEFLGPDPTAEDAADFLWTVFMLPEFQLVR